MPKINRISLHDPWATWEVHRQTNLIKLINHLLGKKYWLIRIPSVPKILNALQYRYFVTKNWSVLPVPYPEGLLVSDYKFLLKSFKNIRIKFQHFTNICLWQVSLESSRIVIRILFNKFHYKYQLYLFQKSYNIFIISNLIKGQKNNLCNSR